MQRRTFLKGATAIANGLLASALGIPAIRYLLGPFWRSRKAPTFIRVAPLSVVPQGRPIRVAVTADRWDAYTHYPPGPIGSVWLLRKDRGPANVAASIIASATPEGMGHPPQADTLRCLQTICPHLGCGIDYATDRGVFSCPCHASEFDLSGRRRFGPAPRNMDELQCRITKPDEQGRRWVEVKYQEFQTGRVRQS